MTPQATTERLSAVERREQIIQAAISVFAEDGYAAASTEEIARRAGISQPYIFRLFRSKHDLVLASIQRCFEETESALQQAADGFTGDEALHAMGNAYIAMIEHDHTRLRAQLHAYVACEDPHIRVLVARNFGRLVDLVRRCSGVDNAGLASFFANGMMLNVLAMMGQIRDPQRWAAELLDGCIKDIERRDLGGGLGL